MTKNISMQFSIQPLLENEKVRLHPLKSDDYQELFEVGCNPKVWINHPNKSRGTQAGFKVFSDGAIQSKGAFIIRDRKNNQAIGCTRFYDYDKKQNSIFIGYTFFGPDYWGKSFNTATKTLMLNYIFQYVDKVFFHVGAENHRSINAMKKLNAQKLREVVVAYYGEPDRKNVEFIIEKSDWISSQI